MDVCNLSRLILIWVILSLGPDIRFYRTLILDEIYQDYVRTARAKGLTEKAIMFKHVLRNAMIPNNFGYKIEKSVANKM